AFRFEGLPGVGLDAKQGIADLLDRLDHAVEMELRIERLDLLHQRVDQALCRRVRDARNVVDRLFGIKLGTLPADLVEDVDEMRLDVEQAKFEHREQPNRARANDQYVGLDGIAHVRLSSERKSPRKEGSRGLDMRGIMLPKYTS